MEESERLHSSPCSLPELHYLVYEVQVASVEVQLASDCHPRHCSSVVTSLELETLQRLACMHEKFNEVIIIILIMQGFVH